MRALSTQYVLTCSHGQESSTSQPSDCINLTPVARPLPYPSMAAHISATQQSFIVPSSTSEVAVAVNSLVDGTSSYQPPKADENPQAAHLMPGQLQSAAMSRHESTPAMY
jgi:hypothetical protein